MQASVASGTFARMKIPSLFHAFRFAEPVALRRAARRPFVEILEDRLAPATIFLVAPSEPLDATHRYLIQDAINFAGVGGTVIVQPGTSSQSGTANINIDSLTIMGDPLASVDSLQSYDFNINDSSGVTLSHLNLGDVTLSATAHNVTVTGSHLKNFTETGGMSGVGNNTLRHNVITGAVDLQGNSDAGQVTADSIAENTFVGSAPVQLGLTNSNQTSIENNHFTNSGSSAAGIRVRSNSEGVTISGNTIEMVGSGSTYGIYLLNTGGAAGNLLSAKVTGNSISAGPSGTALLCNLFGTGTNFTVQVEGNDVNRSKIGIEVYGLPGATGAGFIDLGGGTNSLGTSKGGNNFRSFDGLNGHYAIYLHSTDAGITVPAQGNIFDNAVAPAMVVKDGGNGGGSGIVDVSNSLDPNHAYVQSLYTQLLGRVADPAAGGELDQGVAKLVAKGRKAVAKSILLSNESLGLMANDVVGDYLHRDIQTPELTKFGTLLAAGKDITVVEANVLGSIDYQNNLSKNYVQALYQDLLGRAATTTEVIKGYNKLRATGLKGLAATIANSKERRVDVVKDYYHDLLHRDATAAETDALTKKPGLLKTKLQILSSDDFYNHG